MTPIDVLITFPLSPASIERIQAVSPKLRLTVNPARKAEEISTDRWQSTEILFTDSALPDISRVNRLRWIQSNSTDIEYIRQSILVNKDGLVITNTSGITSHSVAEYAIMMMLVSGHQFQRYLGTDIPSVDRKEFPSARWNLSGSVAGIIGYGSIGREIARLLQPFGVTILATKRDVMNPKDTGYSLPGMGDPEGDFFHRLYPAQAVRSMLRECDYVVLSVPYYQATHAMINETLLGFLKPTAFLINVSNLETVDIKALSTALQEKRISGAVMDSPSVGTIPADHVLRKLSNVILTLGIAGETEDYIEKAIDLFIANMRRYIGGIPLLNQYNPVRGY